MRPTRIPRHPCVLATAAIAGVLSAATPASADVTVRPPSATQGTGSNQTFHVVNDHPTAAMTKIRLVLPAATPVAEVYPLSVDDWAPTITNRKLNPPMKPAHGGSLLTEATGAITWTAAPGKALPPGKAADLMIAIGPLPQTDKMAFELQATYADGSTGPAIAPAVLTLTPAEAQPPADAAPVDEAPPAADDAGGSGPWSAAGWVLAVLVAATATVMVLRTRRSAAGTPGDDPEAAQAGSGEAGGGKSAETGPADATPREDPAERAHRARVSAWSYRDGP